MLLLMREEHNRQTQAGDTMSFILPSLRTQMLPSKATHQSVRHGRNNIEWKRLEGQWSILTRLLDQQRSEEFMVHPTPMFRRYSDEVGDLSESANRVILWDS